MFDYLKEYVVNNEKGQNNYKNIFYKVSEDDIESAEVRMKLKFPEEISTFYKEIGYGFFYDKEECYTDVFMSPQNIADFICEEGNYFYSEEREFLKKEDMVFFEIDSNCHIYIKIDGENRGKIYLGRKKIAESLEEFVWNLYQKSNYFFTSNQ